MFIRKSTHGYYWGNLAIVAMRFYIATGNPGELDAAYWYIRYAFRAAGGL